MSGRSIFSSGAVPAVALWYQVGFPARLWEDEVLLGVNWQCTQYRLAAGGKRHKRNAELTALIGMLSNNRYMRHNPLRSKYL